jgi:hypothetical protein
MMMMMMISNRVGYVGSSGKMIGELEDDLMIYELDDIWKRASLTQS